MAGLYIGAGILAAIFIVYPFSMNAKDPSPSRLAFVGSASTPFEWITMCLGQNWDGQLNLRVRKAPKAEMPTARFDNPVQHFIVDVVDQGNERVVRGYSRRGEPFTARTRKALSGCLNGDKFVKVRRGNYNGS